MLIVNSGDTPGSLEMIGDAIAVLADDYEADGVARIVLFELYENLLGSLNMDFQAADRVLLEALGSLAEQKVQIGRDMTPNPWLH